MNFNLSTWVGQVTTAHGAMILGPTLLAVASGTMTWPTALPLLVAGVVGLLWPESVGLKSAAQNVSNDVEALIAAYRTGLRHGAATPPNATVAPAPTQAVTASMLALLFASAFALTACTNQTPTQQAAASAAVASGLLCLADASGKIVGTATTSDPDAVKALNSAVAAGSTLLTDAACQSAVSNGLAASANPAPTTR